MTDDKKGILVVVSGPSGVGKDTVVNQYLKSPTNSVLSVSATTRAPREGEVNGKDYFFLSTEIFEQYIKENRFLEYAKYGDNYYGTLKEVVDSGLRQGNNVILVIETKGAAQIRQLYPNALFIFIMPPNMRCLKDRLISRRTETLDAIEQRLNIAFGEIELGKGYDFIVVNNELDEAVKRFGAIISAAECSVKYRPNLLKGVCDTNA